MMKPLILKIKHATFQIHSVFLITNKIFNLNILSLFQKIELLYFSVLNFILKIIFLSILICDDFLAILTALDTPKSKALKVNLKEIMESFSKGAIMKEAKIQTNKDAWTFQLG